MRASVEDNAGGNATRTHGLAWLYVGAHGGGNGLRMAVCLADEAAEHEHVSAWASRSDVAQALGLRKVSRVGWEAEEGGGRGEGCARVRRRQGEEGLCVPGAAGSSHMLSLSIPSPLSLPHRRAHGWRHTGAGGGRARMPIRIYMAQIQ